MNRRMAHPDTFAALPLREKLETALRRPVELLVLVATLGVLAYAFFVYAVRQ